MSLRYAAPKVETVHGGYLINYRPYGEAVRQTWDTGDPDLPRQILLRFQIESRAKVSDDFFLNLQKNVLTSDGWHALIRGLQHDNSHVYGVKALHEWVFRESRWPDDVKATCHAAFRKAVLEIIEDKDEIWACSIDSLRVLAETISSDTTPLTDREKTAFKEAGKLVAGTIADNDDDPDNVGEEAKELLKLEQLCGVSFTEEIAALEGQAADLSTRSSSGETYDPESSYSSQRGSARYRFPVRWSSGSVMIRISTEYCNRYENLPSLSRCLRAFFIAHTSFFLLPMIRFPHLLLPPYHCREC
jgi:hypothetical protein